MRLLFILGNLASRSQEAREQLYQTPQCVEVLLDLYHTYQERRESPTTPDQTRDPTMGPLKPPTPRAQARDSGAGGQDVLVKLVRVLANMSIHSAVGPALAASTPCVQLLLDTLGKRERHRLTHRYARAHTRRTHAQTCTHAYIERCAHRYEIGRAHV